VTTVAEVVSTAEFAFTTAAASERPDHSLESPMPSAFSHAVAALGIAAACFGRAVPARVLGLGALCAAIPDLDVIGFRFGVRSGDLLGHRAGEGQLRNGKPDGCATDAASDEQGHSRAIAG